MQSSSFNTVWKSARPVVRSLVATGRLLILDAIQRREIQSGGWDDGLWRHKIAISPGTASGGLGELKRSLEPSLVDSESRGEINSMDNNERVRSDVPNCEFYFIGVSYRGLVRLNLFVKESCRLFRLKHKNLKPLWIYFTVETLCRLVRLNILVWMNPSCAWAAHNENLFHRRHDYSTSPTKYFCVKIHLLLEHHSEFI